MWHRVSVYIVYTGRYRWNRSTNHTIHSIHKVCYTLKDKKNKICATNVLNITKTYIYIKAFPTWMSLSKNRRVLRNESNRYKVKYLPYSKCSTTVAILHFVFQMNTIFWWNLPNFTTTIKLIQKTMIKCWNMENKYERDTERGRNSVLQCSYTQQSVGYLDMNCCLHAKNTTHQKRNPIFLSAKSFFKVLSTIIMLHRC